MNLKSLVEREPINLQGGWPTPRLHPVEAMRTATLELFARDDIHELLKYGPEHGDASLRSNLGQWLSSYFPRAGSIDGNRIIVTNGASNGLATILQKFADINVTKTIWMVEPAYFLACPVFRDAGFSGRIRGVPEGIDGIDLAYFESALKSVACDEPPPMGLHPKTPKNGYQKTYSHILYMVPTFSNPSGRTMSLPQRERLIRLARQYDVLVITDDVYDLLHWPISQSGIERKARVMPRLVDIDRSLEGANEFGNAVSNGSFSKIVAPGVRVGWLESMPAFVQSMGTV